MARPARISPIFLAGGTGRIRAALRAALLAEWNFDDDANDSSGNGKNLTITNPPAVYAAGKVGTKCFVCDGSMISPWGSTAATLVTTGSWWFSFWLKFTSTAGFCIGGQTDSDALASGTVLIDTLAVNKRPSIRVINTSSVDTKATVATDQNDGNWHLYNCWYDASGTPSVNMNVDNGTTVTTPMVGTVRYDATVFRVGHSIGVPGIHEDLNLPGSLDAWHVFNRIPTVAELAYLYNSGAGRQLN